MNRVVKPLLPLLAALGATLATYAAFAFIAWQGDMTKWDAFGRFLFIVIALLTSVGAGLLTRSEARE